MPLINDFLSLIYPRLCEACGQNLFRHEKWICNRCRVSLPRSRYHEKKDNALTKLFTGRIPIERAASFYVFEKSGKIQRMLHAIKYQDQKELAEVLGKLYSTEISGTGCFQDVDLILPVPLHKRKLKSRGYNQSAWFAKGLSAGLMKPVAEDLMERRNETATQTRKKKYERWENVEGIFELKAKGQLENKHVLLVDDVITTGATLEAAWMALKEAPGLKLSIASIAFATNTLHG